MHSKTKWRTSDWHVFIKVFIPLLAVYPEASVPVPTRQWVSEPTFALKNELSSLDLIFGSSFRSCWWMQHQKLLKLLPEQLCLYIPDSGWFLKLTAAQWTAVMQNGCQTVCSFSRHEDASSSPLKWFLCWSVSARLKMTSRGDNDTVAHSWG